MLVLALKENEKLQIGNVTVLIKGKAGKDRYRIGIEAPKEIDVQRESAINKKEESDD